MEGEKLALASGPADTLNATSEVWSINNDSHRNKRGMGEKQYEVAAEALTAEEMPASSSATSCTLSTPPLCLRSFSMPTSSTVMRSIFKPRSCKEQGVVCMKFH